MTIPGGDQIVDQAAAGGPAPPRAGWREVLAIAGLVSIWPIGAVLLWTSRVWSTRAKLIGTLVPPGGYLSLAVAYQALAYLEFALVSAGRTVDDLRLANAFNNVALAVWTVLPVATGIYLAALAW